MARCARLATGLHSNPSIPLLWDGHWEYLLMKDVYAVLRQKELDQSRLENEVEALRFVAPLLDDGDAKHNNQPTSRRAVNVTPQPDPSGRQASSKTHWP